MQVRDRDPLKKDSDLGDCVLPLKALAADEGGDGEVQLDKHLPLIDPRTGQVHIHSFFTIIYIYTYLRPLQGRRPSDRRRATAAAPPPGRETTQHDTRNTQRDLVAARAAPDAVR